MVGAKMKSVDHVGTGRHVRGGTMKPIAKIQQHEAVLLLGIAMVTSFKDEPSSGDVTCETAVF
jgi:hypothetical protein